MDAELRERCRQVVERMLAARDWQLVYDAADFADDVTAEVERRLAQTPAQPIEQLAAHVVARCYSRVWHAACRLDGTARQRRAFEEIHRYLYDIGLYRTGRDEYLAQECAQNAALKVWQNLGRVEDPGSFLWWLQRVAHNEANRLLAAGRRKTTDATGAAVWHDYEIPMSDYPSEPTKARGDDDADFAAPPDSRLTLTAEVRARLEAAIRNCLSNTQHQDVLIKTFLDHKSRQAVAEEMNISPGFVSVYKMRGLSKLKNCREFLDILEDLL